MKDRFINWLKENKPDLKDSSIEKYSRAVRTISEQFVVGRSLYKIDSYDEAREVVEKIYDNAEFVQKNERGNRMYSNALDKYLEFLYSLR